MPETRARDLANLAGAGATSSTVAYHQTARDFTLPAGTGAASQVISSDGDGTTTWADVALTPEITGLAWYSDSGYSSTLTSAEAINLDDATYLKVTGKNLASTSAFQTTAYVQIINTTQSNAVVGHNQNSLNGCVTASTYVNETEVRFTINPNGISGINAGDTLKAKYITDGGESLFATGYAVSADPTLVTTVNSATVADTQKVGTVGGRIAGGSQAHTTELLLNFDRANSSTDLEDSSNIGRGGSKVTVHNGGNISTTTYKITGKTNNSSLGLYGSNDHVKVSNNIVPDFMSETSPHDFTVDAWIYPTSSPGDKVIWGHSAHNGYNFGLGFHVTSDVNNYYGGFRGCAYSWSNTGGTGGASVDGKGADTVSLSNNTWYHCLWHVHWPTEQPVCDFFLDGVYKGRTTHNTSSTAHRTIANFTDTAGATDMFAAVGALVDYQGTDTLHFEGHIDRLRVCSGDTTKVSDDPLYFATAFASRVKGTTYFTPTSTLYGGYRSDTIDTVTLTGSAGVGGGHVTFNNATLSTDGNNTETPSSLPAGLSLSPTPYTGSVASITGTLTAGVGSHAINLVARVTSDGTDANIDQNRKQAYSHTIEKISGSPPSLFSARRYMGTGVARKIEGLGFQPDLVWFKTRDHGHWHSLCDSVRGVQDTLYANSNSATNSGTSNALSSFDADGFSIGTEVGLNMNDKKIIAFGWKAGGQPSGTLAGSGATASLTNGFGNGTIHNSATGVAHATGISQTVNQNGGFSITKYTGTAADNTLAIPHNLGGTPDVVLIKPLASNDWYMWHVGLGASGSAGNFIALNGDKQKGHTSTGSSIVNRDIWGTGHDSTVMRFKSSGSNGYLVNYAGDFIVYAWKDVTDVSAFGEFTGNGYASNTPKDVVLGFHPKLLILKRANTTGNWHMYDFFRSNNATNAGASNNTGHSMQPPLFINDPDTEDTHQTLYFGATDSDSVTWYTSGSDKGFRINDNNGEINGSGDTILYMAWA